VTVIEIRVNIEMRNGFLRLFVSNSYTFCFSLVKQIENEIILFDVSFKNSLHFCIINNIFKNLLISVCFKKRHSIRVNLV
jgi:hypothetical protein